MPAFTRICLAHSLRRRRQAALTTIESLVSLVLCVALLWLGIPLVLVNIGWIKAPEAARTQPILMPPPPPSSENLDDDPLLELPPINSFLEKPALPESLKKVTKGQTPASPFEPTPK